MKQIIEIPEHGDCVLASEIKGVLIDNETVAILLKSSMGKGEAIEYDFPDKNSALNAHYKIVKQWKESLS